MIHQRQLVVGELVPALVRLKRAGRAAAVGVPDIEGDAAIGIAELDQRIKRVGAVQHSDSRIQAAARDDQKRKALAGFLVVDADRTILENRHCCSPCFCLGSGARGRH